MQGLCPHLTGGFISLLYMQCSDKQSIYAQLTGGPDLGVGVVVFKASMIN